MGLLQQLNPFRRRFAEALGKHDPENQEGWRRLSGDVDRDLALMKQERMVKVAAKLWESNLLANRLIELPLAYLLAKGCALRVDDDDAQRVLDRHWRDGINRWSQKLPMRVRELSLFGEQVWIAFRGEQSGFVRWGYLDPGLIGDVVSDPDNIEQPIVIERKADPGGRVRRYRVIVNVPEDAFGDQARALREEAQDGECLYFAINRLSAGRRGRSDLLPQFDWLDGYDHLLFGELDRTDMARAFIWDVLLKGANQEDVKAYQREVGTPAPGSVRVHNEQVEWNAVSPDLKAADSEAAARLFRNHILGGATVPEHWYGGAADVNRSTGQSMSEPTEKVMEMRQAFVGDMLVDVGTYVLRAAWRSVGEELTEEQERILDSMVVDWPEMSAKDASRYAAALQQVVAAAAIAKNDGLVTHETAVRLVAAISAELGVEIDVEAELKAATEELRKQREEDGFIPGLGLEGEGAGDVDGDDAE